VFLHHRSRQVLQAFLQAEHQQADGHSVASAAAALGLPSNVVAYWVGRWQRAGVLAITSASKPKRYRALAEAVFVPFAALEVAEAEGLLAQVQAQFLQQFQRSLLAVMREREADWGYCLSISDNQAVLTLADNSSGSTLNSRHPAAPATVNLWGVLQLDFAEAKAFQGEVFDLYQRYLAKRGGQRYLVRLGSVPIEG
jgi:transposase